jgi:hypothetical protein
MSCVPSVDAALSMPVVLLWSSDCSAPLEGGYSGLFKLRVAFTASTAGAANPPACAADCGRSPRRVIHTHHVQPITTSENQIREAGLAPGFRFNKGLRVHS